MTVGSGASTARAVVSSLPRKPLGLPTTSSLITELLALNTWAARVSFLGQHAALVHQVIADRCRTEGAEQLALFIERATAVGLDQALVELDVLQSLDLAVSAQTASSIEVVEHAAAMIVSGSAWLLPEFIAAAGSVSQRLPDSSTEIRRIVVPALAAATSVTAAEVDELLVLATTDWEDVWPVLETVSARDSLMCPFPAARAVAEISADLPQLSEWLLELEGLLDAARVRGAEAAQAEHRMRILAGLFADGEELEEFDDPAAVCSQLAAELAVVIQQTGATWVIPSAIAVARKALSLTDPTSALRAGRLSNLSALLIEGVQANVVPPSRVEEALKAAREAFEIGSPDPAVYARLAANLGNRISQAIDAGICEPTDLAEAVDLHDCAWELTGPDDPLRPQRASNLSSLLGNAVEAGILPPSDLARALELQDEAVSLAEPDGPDLPWYLSNRANRVALAVQLSVLPPESLLNGIHDLRRALAIAKPGHPGNRGIASNLSALLSEGVHANLLPASCMSEAIALAQAALESTPTTSADWPTYANNLANRLGVGVTTGLESVDRLATAVDLSQLAVDATPVDHPARPGRIATLIGRTLAAIDAGVVAPDKVKGVLAVAEPMWLTMSFAHPLRAKLANDMAVLLSEAVKLDVLEPDRLVEAVELAEEGVDLLSPDEPDWAESTSNLSAILSEAIHHELLPASRLTAVVDLARSALDQVLDGPLRPGLATNASALIAEAIAAGVLAEDRIEEALRLQQEALDLVPFPHPDRPAYAANLIQRVADALAHGVIDTDDALARVNLLVDEAWKQATTSVTPHQRQRAIALTARLIKYAPLLLTRLTGDLAESALAVEVLRGHLFRGMRAPRLTSGVVSDECERRYRAAAENYDLSQLHAIDGVGTYGDSIAAFRELTDAMAQVIAEDADAGLGSPPSRTDLLNAIPRGVSVIYLLTGMETSLSSYPGAAVVFGTEGSNCVELPGLTQPAVAENVAKLLDAEAVLEDVCSWLWETVAQPLLDSAGESENQLGSTAWAFVLTGLIGMLPIHAATDGASTLDDHARVLTIRGTLPLNAVQAAPPAQHPPMAMALQAADLKFTAADMAVAGTLIPKCRVLSCDCEPTTLLAALSEASAALFSGHALHALDVGGSLQLGPPGSDLWLTAEDVMRLPTRRRGLVILAACSSGQAALSLPEEAVGLPTALLSIGFRSVISTLWPVRDSVAFITVARFLQLKALDPTAADDVILQETRKWLRQASCDELLIWLDKLEDRVEMDRDVTDTLRHAWKVYPDLMNPVPYADPRDWAAFFCTGASPLVTGAADE